MDHVSPVGQIAHPEQHSLRHVLVVGGGIDDWDSVNTTDWQTRATLVGSVAEQAGVRWVTLVPYGPSAGRTTAEIERQLIRHGSSDVIIEPHADGRQRFAAAMESMAPNDPVNEASVAAVLYEPADAEPDLVVVFGPPTQLPESLVWELAYAELVFTDASWTELDPAVLADAFADFSGRRRRFGGLDD